MASSKETQKADEAQSNEPQTQAAPKEAAANKVKTTQAVRDAHYFENGVK